jgi:hypothetical protein
MVVSDRSIDHRLKRAFYTDHALEFALTHSMIQDQPFLNLSMSMYDEQLPLQTVDEYIQAGLLGCRAYDARAGRILLWNTGRHQHDKMVSRPCP